MKITSNASELHKQLLEIQAKVKRKLEGMVRGFAYSIAMEAINKTPLGDSEQYARYYKARTEWPQVEGLARGNWQYSESGPVFRLIAGQDSGNAALDQVEVAAMQYKLGDSFSIGNATPYIMALENGYSRLQAPQGITNPTMQAIQVAYKTDLQSFYDSTK